MKLKFTYEVNTISRVAPNGGTQVYPNPGEPSPPGVGVMTTGRYTVSPNHSGISGDYIYTRVNAYSDEDGVVTGDGTITFRLRRCDDDIRITSVFTIRFTDAEEPFSVIELNCPIAFASINGRPAHGTIKFRPIQGGRQYRTKLRLHLL